MVDTLIIDVISKAHGKALVDAARYLGLRTWKPRGGPRHVEVTDAFEAYRYGNECIKRWRYLVKLDRTP